jgi:hypothetical protein
LRFLEPFKLHFFEHLDFDEVRVDEDTIAIQGPSAFGPQSQEVLLVLLLKQLVLLGSQAIRKRLVRIDLRKFFANRQ